MSSVLSVTFIMLVMLLGQYVHIYFKWTEYRQNAKEEEEDNFWYYFKQQMAVVIPRMVIILGLALWIGLTPTREKFTLAFGDFTWPFYAFIGYSLDSFVKNMLDKLKKKSNAVGLK